MRTAEELDRRFDETVKRFPDGMSAAQFRQVTLESADEDGKIYPHDLQNWFHRQSILMSMFFDGLIQNRGGYNKPFDWYITDKGRELLNSTK